MKDVKMASISETASFANVTKDNGQIELLYIPSHSINYKHMDLLNNSTTYIFFWMEVTERKPINFHSF